MHLKQHDMHLGGLKEELLISEATAMELLPDGRFDLSLV